MGWPRQELIDPRPIETERLLLEPVDEVHADALYEAVVASRDELLPWMPWASEPSLEGSHEQTKESRRAWLEGTNFHFAVIERQTGMVLGVAGFNNELHDAPELHYWIRTDHSRRGLATEACRALIDWARRTLRVNRLSLWAGTENAASRRVAEKLGFVHRGPLSWRPEGGLGTFPAESYELVVSEVR